MAKLYAFFLLFNLSYRRHRLFFAGDRVGRLRPDGQESIYGCCSNPARRSRPLQHCHRLVQTLHHLLPCPPPPPRQRAPAAQLQFLLGQRGWPATRQIAGPLPTVSFSLFLVFLLDCPRNPRLSSSSSFPPLHCLLSVLGLKGLQQRLIMDFPHHRTKTDFASPQAPMH